MRLSDWLRLLVRHRCAVHPTRWGLAFMVTLIAAVNSCLRLVQRLVFGRRLARTPLAAPPIFIIGHWRSGTTFLHELFELDPRFTSPTTCQCFLPHHFLLTGWFMRRFMKFLLPRMRPMDNVATGWDRPQEDEFALVALGVPSPYLTIAFPNHGPQCGDYLDLEGLPPADLARWQQALREFLTAVTCQSPRPIVLKSPPHTGRIHVLHEMFPGAKFIHIVRDPLVVFPSTVRLWKSLYETQALQRPNFAGLDEIVWSSFERMYASFERHKSAIPPEQIIDIRYEDLARDPVGQMERIYTQLNLPDFATTRPALEAFARAQASYRTNRYQLPPHLQSETTRRWSGFARQYGYEQGEAAPP